MSIHGILGEATSYPKTYNPEWLFAIARSQGRSQIAWQADKLSVGVDWWHAFEVSWLNPQGISQVALARFAIPASSVNIVESKSLKLYLNSLNFTKFDNWQGVEQTISQDLSACVGETVTVELLTLAQANQDKSDWLMTTPNGQCIDNALDGLIEYLPLTEQPNASLLVAKEITNINKLANIQHNAANCTTDTPQTYQFYSNLLRSNCPVTNQPDWGTLAIEMDSTVTLNASNLLAYVLSFRQHNGFHEQCVEQIFADLSQYFNPQSLMVRAWYTRRGGIDINPCRVSDLSLLPKPSRLIRQ